MSGKKLNILLLEAFHTGSHRRWAIGIKQHSRHNIHVLSLPGRNWKWRMHGAAVYFADKINKTNRNPDIILATDMLDFTIFIALTKNKLNHTKFLLYFHENQLTYPWSPTDSDVKMNRDYHYAFINYVSALAADKVYFNSLYHQKSFTDALPEFLKHFPDYTNPENMDIIRKKSKVLPLGLDLISLDKYISNGAPRSANVPVILWNHRWEYDKNPELFFESLFKLHRENIDFRLIVLGESFKTSPEIFKLAKEKLEHKIIHFAYADSLEEYYSLVAEADIIPVTSHQDFFGGSIVEAIYMGCIPLLPQRLAYPEHIPIGLRDLFLYKNEADYYLALRKIVLEIASYKPYLPELKEHVSRYDWQQLAIDYDRVFLEDM